jgi:hypothetical protein
MSKSKICNTFRAAVCELRDKLPAEHLIMLQRAERAFSELRHHDLVTQARVEHLEAEVEAAKVEAAKAKAEANRLFLKHESLAQQSMRRNFVRSSEQTRAVFD